MMTKTAGESAQNLRQKAEEKLGRIEAMTSNPLSPIESEQLLHELRVHQIELEMQNEELLRLQAELVAELANLEQRVEERTLELIKSEYSLRLSEEQMLMAQQIGNTGSWVYNIVTDKIWGSAEGFRIFGFPPVAGDFPIDDVEACIPERERIHQALVDLIRDGQAYNLEYAINPADGSPPKVLHSIARLEKDVQGNPLTVLGFIQDITQKKLADNTLHEMADKLETQADALRWLNASRMNELSCLYGIINLFNFPSVTLDEILSEVVLLIPSGWQFPEITEARIVIAGVTYQTPRFRETPWMLTREIFRDDNPIGHLTVCYLEKRQTEDKGPFCIEERNLLYAIAEKIGLGYERKQVETELQESNARFEQLAEQSGTVVWEIDTKGLLTYISHVSESVFGYHPDEVTGKMHFYDIHPESVREDFKQAAFKVMERMEPLLHVEHTVQAKDGRIVWVTTSGIPILDDEGTLLGYRGRDTDITEKKNVMEQLIHSQKMESIGQLAGGLAHDLNNILTVINGYATLAKNGLNKEQFEFQCINTILESSSKASLLTHSLLAYSRKQEMNQQNQNLNSLIETIALFIRRIIQENIEFSFSAGDDPLFVYVDALQIEQVLMNFATNARDAMPMGGSFSIATAAGSIDEQYISTRGYGVVGDYAVITVSDTGHGMDAQTQLKIFDPFFTTKEVGKGTGLGLSMVMGIIKQHGGFVDVESEPGKGTIFRMYLPLVEVEVVFSAPETEEVLMEKASGTIMIVEDDECTRAMLEELLTRVGYTVIAAVDGQDAVEKFAARKDDIQLVISDVIMPRKSGKAACDEIRLMSDKTKVIFFSGHTYNVIEREAELGTEAEVIVKPIMPFELLSKIREIMNKLS